MEVRNSLSKLLNDLLMQSGNSVRSFASVNEAITSDAESVTLNIENADGTVDHYTIPSFGYLKNAITRLENTINAISNIGGGGSTVRLSDGTYRRLMTVRLPSEAADIQRMPTLNTFSVKSNYFFENMLNPMLYVTVPLDGQIDNNTERVMVKRFLLDTDTTAKSEIFDTTLKNRSNIDYDEFLQILIDNDIHYVLDEESVPLTPRTRRYTGTFSVLRISNDSHTELINGVEITSTRKLVRLDKLLYTDTSAGYEDTMQLTVGDTLEVVSSPIDTKYRVKNIDTSTNTVVLELIEGVRALKVGAGYLRISSEKTQETSIDCSVGYDERCVVFVKPIDPESNMAASHWSPGTAFYSNDLTLDMDGATVSLQQYYQKNVIDFGSYLLGYAHDWYPTSTEGVKPNTPELNPNDFKVVQINRQATENEDITRIERLNTEKNNLRVQIEAKESAIDELKSKLQSTTYANDILRTNDRVELQNKRSEYESLVNEYNSKVRSISSLASSAGIASTSPKYRVRGFWALPQPQSTPATGPQAIIGFKIRYRYLNLMGDSNALEQIGEETSGTFSNYVLMDSVLRGRHKDASGDFVWDAVDNNDPDEVSINRLDIPITKGEQIEIQVRAMSEAGFPANPLLSDWSEPVVITFPEEYSTDSVAEDILSANRSDESQLQIDQTLVTRGLIGHISDSFYANETSFAHSALNIASGFVSENQTPISLYTKISELEATIKRLSAIVGETGGEMSVTLTDEIGNTYELKPDALTKIYAGAYESDVQEASGNGAIVTKNYYINITNKGTGDLVLYTSPETKGGRGNELDETSDPEYYGVPVGVYALDTYLPGIMHRQHKNQFLYMRMKDIEGSRLYATGTSYRLAKQNNDLVVLASSDSSNILYPINTYPTNTDEVGDPMVNVPEGTFPAQCGFHTGLAEGEVEKLGYGNNNTVSWNGEDTPGQPFYDGLLKGAYTCGSFAYLNIPNFEAVQVDGDTRNSSHRIASGESVRIPITFQYRMKDVNGELMPGADPQPTETQARVCNRIGFDIWNTKTEPVSFDLEIYATYKENIGSILPKNKVLFSASDLAQAVNSARRGTNSVII